VKAFPQWIVYTAVRVDGQLWHVFPSRKLQRAFARQHGGAKYQLVKAH